MSGREALADTIDLNRITVTSRDDQHRDMRRECRLITSTDRSTRERVEMHSLLCSMIHVTMHARTSFVMLQHGCARDVSTEEHMALTIPDYLQGCTIGRGNVQASSDTNIPKAAFVRSGKCHKPRGRVIRDPPS